MIEYKNEIMRLFHDLDMSQSDSFSEMIIAEDVDDLLLSESDLFKAKELRDDLRKKNEKMIEKIKSTKFKIKQLWSKLQIENEMLVDLVNNQTINDCESENHMTKSKIISIVNLIIDLYFAIFVFIFSNLLYS